VTDILGLRQGVVALVPHSEAWHDAFAEEAASIRAALGDRVKAIEHIGSTAVCGLSAKPIIDVAAGIDEPMRGAGWIADHEALGYEYRGESGVAGRSYFVKGDPRTYHLHVLHLQSEAWRNHIAFRDCLRANGEVAKEYEQLKRALAARHRNDRESYTRGKAAFIRHILGLP
jgi:GrpB-like predicted nucleotidyltransferase (UPF0157 family)